MKVIPAVTLSAAILSVFSGAIAPSPTGRNTSALLAAPATTSTTVAPAARDAEGVDGDADGLPDGEDPCPNEPRNACFGAVAVDAITYNPIRVNAGPHESFRCARTQLDCNGDQWLADFGYLEPGRLTGCPKDESLGPGCVLAGVEGAMGCDDAATRRIFRCGHRARKDRSLVYVFGLEPGSYVVNFFFAARAPRSLKHARAGGVSILLNDLPAYTGFDPAEVTADAGAIVVRAALVDIEAGENLTIELQGMRRRTALRAFEVLSPSGGAQNGGDHDEPDPQSEVDPHAAATATDQDEDGLVGAADPCPADVRNRCVGPIATDTATGKQIRVNANVSAAECAGTKIDCAGDVWNADFGYNDAGKAHVCNLAGGGEGCVIYGIPALFGCDSESTEDLFQCQHSDPDLAYAFSVPNGRYVVNLFFASTLRNTREIGSRVFDIDVEGVTAYDDFDQVAVARGNGKALLRAVVADVTDGELNIEFGKETENPALKAIEVYAFPPPPCTGASQCNDGNPCTDDACIGGSCANTNNSDPCASDGNPCTTDVCSAGSCTHPDNSDACADDGNPCTTDVCNAGTCTHPNNSASCADDGNPCTTDVCSGGTCTHPSKTASCDDGLACTTGDTCVGGECVGTSTCPAGQTCSPTGQCTAASVDGDNDGLSGSDDPCPEDPRNLCAGPIATDSTSGNPIRVNANTSTAECAGTRTDCNGDTWFADFGYNQSARAHACDLGGGCVIGGIEEIFGCESESTEDLFQCSHSDLPASPELEYSFAVPNARYVVNLYFANTAAGTTAPGSRTFDIRVEGITAYEDFDQVAAAGGSAKAVVRSVVADVTDGDGLQIEFGHEVENPSIKAIEVLFNGPVPCTSASACNDNNPCTTDACNDNFCENTPNTAPCSDGNPCTDDVCSGGACQSTPNTAPCNDGNPCTDDVCSGGACQGTPNAAPCSDGNPCTDDVCSGGACESTPNTDPCSSDGNPCTDDVCSGGTCQNMPNDDSCNDGVACTSGDVCSNGTCRGNSTCPSGQTCSTVTGTCTASSQISFGKSNLAGATLTKPTSLQFGPDGKLYVSQQDGVIKVYSVTRDGPNDYRVTATQTITSIQSIPNRNDNGALNTSITKRLVTGLLVTGTAANPRIYVTSSDPRIGGGTESKDTNLDTNSGILSRLTWNGSSWAKLDLVRGLPRSEENHTANGMALDTATNTLYIAQGGNTNQGATSNNFVFLPEYALSAAILSVDLDAIGNSTYDLPTLDDETRAGDPDANDPFGGNNGKNQAKIVPGGPVQVHSPGWRNAYDVVITELGKMYSIDNGANAGWGDVPVGNGTSSCTNGVKEPGQSLPDNLHLISGPGYYAGHPNPTRGNANNKFNSSNPQSPVPASNPVECTFKEPGVDDGALATFSPSTNGLTEYTASNFGGQMKGDLLAAGWNNSIFRIDLNSSGTAVNKLTVLFSSVAPSSKALDITAQGDAGPFAGSIWATDYNGGNVIIYEADDTVACGGGDDPGADDDADGFDNADEIDNGTDPCSAGDTPADADGDFDSDLNDPDDDNDGLLDDEDPFALDADNGSATSLPVLYAWENGDSNPGGILNLGFTGLMTNGVDDYEDLFNPDDLTASGAAGVLTIDMVPAGDAYGLSNTQEYGFQFGIDVTDESGVFTAHTRVVAPFAGLTPEDFQSMGLFVGTGGQDNYVKITTSSNGGLGGIELTQEISDAVTPGAIIPLSMPGPDAVDLYLSLDPATGDVQGYYRATQGGVLGSLIPVGAVTVPTTWFTLPTRPAVGIISTSRGPAPPFAATWDFIEVTDGGAQ